MPSFVVKVDQATDRYFYWSTIVDCPVFMGTRKKIKAHMLRQDGTNGHPEERLERADKTGTSAMFWDRANPEGGWGDKTLMVREICTQGGMLKREDLGKLWDLYAAMPKGEEPDPKDVQALLTPFDD